MKTAVEHIFDKYQDQLLFSRNVMENVMQESLEKGKLEEKTIIILKAKKLELPLSVIAEIVSLPESEVEEILRQHGNSGK